MNRDVFERIAVALESIAASVKAIAPDPVPDQTEPVGTACPHPDEARIDLSGQGAEEWDCRHCGFQYRGEARN